MPSGRVERIATYVVMVSTAWFALALTWGICAPIGGGHWAIVASRGIIADNLAAWNIWAPLRDYTLDRPTPDLYYLHHPWGTYWVIGLFTKLFGRHPFVPRLEPVLLSVACPPLLYGIGKTLWGPVPGALSALAYVVLPMTLAYGNYPGFEPAVVFGCLVTTWGYLRFQRRWQRRWMLVSLAGVVWSVHADWESCIFLGIVLCTLLVTCLFLPRWFERVDARRFGQWWALSFVIAVLTVFAYLAYVKHAGTVDDFLSAEAKATSGNDAPLSGLLRARRYWIDVTFTPIAIAVGKIALPIFLFRLIVVRRHLEIFPLAMLLMATFQYVHFKSSADELPFWSFPFAPYWALSLGVVGKTALDLARFTAARLDVFDVHAHVSNEAVALGVLGALGLLALLVLPDGVRGMNFARTTGGRLDDHGRRIFQEVDKSAAAAWMTRRMEGRTRVQAHESLHASASVEWALHRPAVATDALVTRAGKGPDRYFMADLAFMKPSEQVKMAAAFHLIAVGQYVLVDRAGRFAPAEGYTFDAREPNALEWFWLGGTEPIRTVRPDPWYTWELRDEFGQSPNPAPPAEPGPQTVDEIRVAHNAAVASGDAARAEALLNELASHLDARSSVRYSDGTVLLGGRLTKGVAPVLDLFFLATGPAAADDLQFEIQSVVERAPFGSLVEADDKTKAAGMPLAIPPKLWKAGFIYASHTEIRHRPGREVFAGFFTGGTNETRPRDPNGVKASLLLTVP